MSLLTTASRVYGESDGNAALLEDVPYTRGNRLVVGVVCMSD